MRSRFVAAVLTLVVLGAAAIALYQREAETTRLASTTPTTRSATEEVDGLARLAKGQMINFIPAPFRKPVPEIIFEDATGKTISLAEFQGKVLLLNVWASWCAPCRRELPTIDRLQAELGGDDFQVLALSIDRDGKEKVDEFLSDMGKPLDHLDFFYDRRNRMGRALGVVGMPTTLLIDRQGGEVGRMVGPAEWDDVSALTLIREVMGE